MAEPLDQLRRIGCRRPGRREGAARGLRPFDGGRRRLLAMLSDEEVELMRRQDPTFQKPRVRVEEERW